MNRDLSFYLCLVLLLVIAGCNNNPPEISGDTVSDHPRVMGVSIWDKISTRSEPRRKSASTTLLSLGESFIYLDTFAIDSNYNNTKFLKVQLSDSSVVWVYGFASVLDAKPVVITNEVPLYMRPDLLTITDKRMYTMEIAAITEEWDNWIKVVGEKKEKEGWIKKEFITNNDIDLALALVVKRKLEEENQEEKIKNLEDLLENNPYPNSIFTAELRERLDNERKTLRDSRQDWDWGDQKRKNRD